MAKKKVVNPRYANVGRKKMADKDKRSRVDIFIKNVTIEKHGGKESVKEKCTKFLEEGD